MSMGQRIKEQRLIKEWTQQQLAEKLDVSIDTIKSLEIGRANPSIETLTKLCDIFECTADYLMGRTIHHNIVVVEKWNEFHSFMGLSLDIMDDQNKAQADLIRKKISIFPNVDEDIPADKEDQVKSILRFTVSMIDSMRFVRKDKDPQ